MLLCTDLPAGHRTIIIIIVLLLQLLNGSRFVVQISALPAAPTDVRISEVTATAVHLEWSYKGPEDFEYYVIQYKRKNANQVSRER